MHGHPEDLQWLRDAFDCIRQLQWACGQRQYRRDQDKHCEPYGDIDAPDDAFRFYCEEAGIDKHSSPFSEEEVHEEGEQQQYEYQLQSIEEEADGQVCSLCQYSDEDDQQCVAGPVVGKEYDGHEKDDRQYLCTWIQLVDDAGPRNISAKQHFTEHNPPSIPYRVR